MYQVRFCKLGLCPTYSLYSLIYLSINTLAINDARLEVTEHYLTLLPSTSDVQVDPTTGCMNFMSLTSFLQCDRELSGKSYLWVQENEDKNYVLFSLRERASISEVHLTYSVDSMTEKPKVSFCAARDDINITNAFTNLTCQEVTIEATNSETRKKIVAMPFTNITSKIAMEVITQGIKASFTATSVEFFGTYDIGKYQIISIKLV